MLLGLFLSSHCLDLRHWQEEQLCFLKLALFFMVGPTSSPWSNLPFLALATEGFGKILGVCSWEHTCDPWKVSENGLLQLVTGGSL